LAQALGCGGHLTRLRRTATGGFVAAQCVTLAALEAMTSRAPGRAAAAEALLPDHTPSRWAADDAARFLTGMRRRGDWPDAPRCGFWRPPRALLGTAHITAGELIPDRLLSPPKSRTDPAQAADGPTSTRPRTPFSKKVTMSQHRFATSPSLPTLTTAKPPWWTNCCASRAPLPTTKKWSIP
jgi:hypothetical protein